MNAPRQRILHGLRQMPPAVWILYLGTFLNKFGAFVIPFLTIYLTSRGFSKGHAAWALFAFGVGQMSASVAGGFLADHIGRRKTIMISMVSVAFALVFLSTATQFSGIWIWTLLVGFTGELYRPASAALLTDLVPPNQRVLAFSGYRLAINAGWAFGPATAGFLAHYSYTWLFLGDALTSLAFGVLAWTALPRGGHSEQNAVPTRVVIRHALRNGPFITVLWGAFLVLVVFMQMSSTFGLHVTQAGFSPEKFGMLLSLNGVLVVALELLISTYSQRAIPTNAISLGYLLIGAGFAFGFFTESLSGLFLAVTLFTFGEMVAFPVQAAYVADLAPMNMRGRYMGIAGFSGALAVVIGPALGVLLFDEFPTHFWMACGILPLLGAWITLRGRRKMNREPSPQIKSTEPAQF